LAIACSLSSCATTEEKFKQRPANPGDNLSERPGGEGFKASHYGTPFGLPLSN
jgi:hypothetical protein